MKTILVLLALVMVTSPVRAANGVTPGQFVIEPATLICLGFEWDITGDDNRNATVEVSYRVSGQTAWKEAHAAAPHGRRADLCARRTRCRTALPEASSTFSPIRNTKSV